MQSNILNRKLFPRTSYSRNGIIHLILFLATCYILFHALKVILIIASANPTEVEATMWPYIALSNASEWVQKPWTLLSYYLVEPKLLTLLTNLLWMYFFGSVLQTLIGYKEIFPLFLFSTIGTGIVFLIVSIWLPLGDHFLLRGASLGIMSFGTAALIIAPTFRYYLSEHFSFPLWAAFLIFLTLNVFLRHSETIYYILVLAAAGLAFGYTQLIKNGIRIGDKWYHLLARVNKKFDGDYKNPTPFLRNQILDQQKAKEPHNELHLNELLEKIHQKGMGSLTKKELEALEKLSQDL